MMPEILFLPLSVISLLAPMAFCMQFRKSSEYSDKASALEIFEKARFSLPKVQNILCNGGYISKPFADI
ncbi:MAG: hypothetical protein LBL38_02455 [Lactobacillales bacterium]|jgi:hypothetical protein|nr:hypothetical protein [Lactobacillales bacterium]